MKDLTVYVLTHNRGELLIETIESILNQTCNDFKFIVSDNSSDDNTYRLLKKLNYLDKFEYRFRKEDFKSIDHFNLCLSEVETKFFILFHDDDLMLPDMVETLYNSIENTDYIAVGCNAFCIYDTHKTKKKMFNLPDNIIIYHQKELINKYMSGNIVPFPSYIYSKTKINDYKFILEAGKYSDATWFLRLLRKGNFLWIHTPHMYYRLHSGQDSQQFDFINMTKLIKIYAEFCPEKQIRIYREYVLYTMLSIELKQKRQHLPSRRYMILYFLKPNSVILFIKLVVKRLIRMLRFKNTG